MARDTHPIHFEDGSADSRYSIHLEYTGHANPHFVARFCDEWIGSSAFYSSALVLAVGHNMARKGQLVVTAAN